MKQSKKPKLSRKDRQIKTAKNLGKGLSPVAAMIEAGYSESYARSQGYAVAKRPYIRSLLTDAIERVLAEQNKAFDDIVRPFVEALDAPVIVKSHTEGIACVAKDPETQEVIPDHDTRMKAATHIVNLMGGFPREVEMPAPPPKGLTVIINKDGESGQVTQPTNRVVDRTKIQPTGEDTGDTMPKVKFTKG
ncbi:MAG: terminase small subunit [Nitrospira sp.]|nr:terminase small subunit [Nitrospira sp.]